MKLFEPGTRIRAIKLINRLPDPGVILKAQKSPFFIKDWDDTYYLCEFPTETLFLYASEFKVDFDVEGLYEVN